MRTIGVVTSARSDYGIYQPVLHQIDNDPELALSMFVSGMHLSHEFGMTVREIEEDGFPIVERIETILSSDSPTGIAKSIGLGVLGFADALQRARCDILLVLGDRFEMFASVVAAIPYNIAIAHIHGGELTEGAIDEVMRHSISKMSHLHFVSTERYKSRLVQMGEAPYRITVSGAPGLDNVQNLTLLKRSDLEKNLNIPLEDAPLLVTFHPVTRSFHDTKGHVKELLTALKKTGYPIVFTYPNADTSGRLIIQAIDEYVANNERAYACTSLGVQRYFSLIENCRAVIGNSSSGIIEVASFSIPVVNIGERQKGRIHGENVVNCGHMRNEIYEAIMKATSPSFLESLKGMTNPYGDGRAATRIVSKLKSVAIDAQLLQKPFFDFPASALQNFDAAAPVTESV